jgi:hypothetical protein
LVVAGGSRVFWVSDTTWREARSGYLLGRCGQGHGIGEDLGDSGLGSNDKLVIWARAPLSPISPLLSTLSPQHGLLRHPAYSSRPHRTRQRGNRVHDRLRPPVRPSRWLLAPSRPLTPVILPLQHPSRSQGGHRISRPAGGREVCTMLSGSQNMP